MLQHEQADPPAVAPTIPLPVSSAAEARVTPDELNAALKALEDRQSSTVAIGSVVDELRLNATPEQIWEQVQKQREDAQRAQATAQTPPVQSSSVTPPKTRPRRRVRWLAVTAIGLIFGGAVLVNTSTHTSSRIVTVPGQTVTIFGDEQVGTIPVEGKYVTITGDDDKITLQGHARSVTVSGDNVHLRGDAPKAFSVTGDDGDVQWTGEPHPVAPRPPSP